MVVLYSTHFTAKLLCTCGVMLCLTFLVIFIISYGMNKMYGTLYVQCSIPPHRITFLIDNVMLIMYSVARGL